MMTKIIALKVEENKEGCKKVDNNRLSKFLLHFKLSSHR